MTIFVEVVCWVLTLGAPGCLVLNHVLLGREIRRRLEK